MTRNHAWASITAGLSLLLALVGTGWAQPAPLAGRVSDPSGRPVSGARISAQGPGQTLSASTDSEGAFSIAVDVAGPFTLAVEKVGFATAVVEASSTAQPLEIRLNLQNLAEAVTVTAVRGRDARVAETAASVTVIDEKSILGAERTLDEVLRARVPGFSLFRRTSSKAANPTSQGVSLRATGGSGASRTAVVDDGVPADDPFGGWIYWSRLPRARIRTVEVVRGSASDAYGSNAIGGVIGIESRPVAPRTLVADVSFGNQESADFSLTGSHAAESAGWGARVSADGATSEGYIPVARAERGPIDQPAGGRNATVEAEVERRFDSNALGSPARVFARGQVFTEHRRNGTTLQRNSTASRMLILGGDAGDRYGDEWRIRAFGGTQGYDQTFTTINATRTTEALNRLQRVPARQLGGSLVWSRPLGWLLAAAGVETRRVRGFSDEIVIDTLGRRTTSTSAGGIQQTWGVFGSAEAVAADRVRFGVSLRGDTWNNSHASTGSRNLLLTNDPFRAVAIAERRQSAFSPRISLVLDLGGGASFRAAVGRGFRAPTLNELFRDFRVGNVLTRGNSELRAERALNREFGILWSSLQGRVSARFTGFITTINDPVANLTLSTTPALITRQRSNLGQSRSRGIEAEIEYRPAPEWQVTGSYLFADARVRKFAPDPVLVGLQLPQVPRHTGTFELRYSSERLFTAGLVGRTTSRSFDDDRNTLPLNKYLVIDAHLERAMNGWVSVYLAVENLFDSEYATGRTPVLSVGSPRAVRVGLHFRPAQP